MEMLFYVIGMFCGFGFIFIASRNEWKDGYNKGFKDGKDMHYARGYKDGEQQGLEYAKERMME